MIVNLFVIRVHTHPRLAQILEPITQNIVLHGFA